PRYQRRLICRLPDGQDLCLTGTSLAREQSGGNWAMFVHICSAGSITEPLIAAPEGWPSGVRHNRRRPLPRPIILPNVPLKLSTLADVRALVHKRLPAQHRSKQTWQRVAAV